MRYFLFIQLALFFFIDATGQSTSQKSKSIVKSNKTTFNKLSNDYEVLNCRVIETAAEYKTCDSVWNEFLMKKVDQHVPKINGAPIGLYPVEVIFIINRDGKISEILPVTNFGYGMEDELKRVLKIADDWDPATRNGRRLSDRKRQVFYFSVVEHLIS